LWGPKNGLQQMPPLYNAYGAAWVLRSKFYKDKQNWTSQNWYCRSLIYLKLSLQQSPSTRNYDKTWSSRDPYLAILWILTSVWLTWNSIRDPFWRSLLTKKSISVVWPTWNPIWRFSLAKAYIVITVGLTWDPFWRPPLTKTKKTVIVAYSTLNPIWRFPLTKMKYEVPSGDLLNIKIRDPFWRSPLTNNL